MNAFRLTKIAVATCVGAIGIPGNTLIIVVFCRKKNKNPTDVSLIFLALLDLILCLQLIEGSATTKSVRWLCVVETILKKGIFCAGLFVTLFIAVCRYFAVCRPFSRRFSSSLAWTVSALSLVLSVLIHLPIAFHTEPQHKEGFTICNAFGKDPLLRKIYVALPSVLFGASLSTIIVLYVKIYRVIRRHQTLRERMTKGTGTSDEDGRISSVSATISSPKSTNNLSTPLEHKTSYQMSGEHMPIDDVSTTADTTGNNISGLDDTVNRIRDPSGSSMSVDPIKTRRTGTEEQYRKRKTPKKQQADHKTTKMLLIMTIIFFVCWFPSVAIQLMTPEQKFSLSQTLPQGVFILAFLYNIRFINQFINVFVYLTANKNFRREFLQLFKG